MIWSRRFARALRPISSIYSLYAPSGSLVFPRYSLVLPPQQLPAFWLFIKPKEFEQTLKQLAMAAYCVVVRDYQNILSPTRVTKVKGS